MHVKISFFSQVNFRKISYFKFLTGTLKKGNKSERKITLDLIFSPQKNDAWLINSQKLFFSQKGGVKYLY